MRIRSSPDFCGWTAVCVHDHAPRMLVLQLSDTILCDHLDILQNITLVNYNDYSMLVKLEQQQVIRKLILENMSNRRWEINPVMIQRYTILVKLGESSCLEHAGVYMLQSCLWWYLKSLVNNTLQNMYFSLGYRDPRIWGEIVYMIW